MGVYSMPRPVVAVDSIFDFPAELSAELLVSFNIISRRILNVVVGFRDAFLSSDDSVDEQSSNHQHTKAKNQIHLKSHAMNMVSGKPLFKICGVA